MSIRRMGRSDLAIKPLLFGGNVFGWTVDEASAFNILDAYVDAGFSAIDTAQGYPNWVPGNPPGLSETIIGNWLKARGRRDRLHIFTKVNSARQENGLGASAIVEGINASLQRLQTDYVDLYFSHWPDATTQHEETLEAYDRLIKAGKVRTIGASNYTSAMMTEAEASAKRLGVPRYEVTQPKYNLYDRAEFEELRPYLLENEVGSIVYYSLAAGFLTGKYRSEADFTKSARGGGMSKYVNDKGLRVLEAMDAVASEHEASLAEVAIAWLIAQPGVTAPIASATTIKQLNSLIKGATLKLTGEQLHVLEKAR